MSEPITDSGDNACTSDDTNILVKTNVSIFNLQTNDLQTLHTECIHNAETSEDNSGGDSHKNETKQPPVIAGKKGSSTDSTHDDNTKDYQAAEAADQVQTNDTAGVTPTDSGTARPTREYDTMTARPCSCP